MATVGSFVISINSQQYSCMLFFMKMNRAAREMTFESSDLVIPLTQKTVNHLSFVSDVFSPTLRGTLAVNDLQNVMFTSLVCDGNLLLRVVIEKSPGYKEEDEETVVFAHDFVVKNMRQMDDVPSILMFDLESLSWFNFNAFVRYSTRGEEKSWSEIAVSLLKNGGMNAELIGSACSSKGSFCAPSNYMMVDSLNYVLDRCFDPDHGFYHVVYDYISKVHSVVCFKDMLRQNASDPLNMKLSHIMTVDTMTSNTADPNRLFGFNVGGEYNFDDLTDCVRSRTIYDYSFKTNSLNSKTIEQTKINQSMPSLKQENNGYVPVFSFPFKFGDFSKHSFSPSVMTSRHMIGRDMKRAFFYSQVASGRILGELNRMAGKPMLLVTNESDSMMQKFKGTWISSKVIHEISFHDGNYRNIVYLSRFDTRDFGKTTYDALINGTDTRIA